MKVDISQNVESHCYGLDNHRKYYEVACILRFSLIIVFNQFDTGQIEEVNHNNALKGHENDGGVFTEITVVPKYIVADP
jgi:hypothetical protein